MLDDNAQIMIEIYDGGKLFLIINETLLLGISLKFQVPLIQMINVLE